MTDETARVCVAVLGSLHLDIMVRAPGRPRQGETLHGSRWWLKHGGKGANQAVAASRHGAAVTMAGAVGADEFGQRLVTHLQTAGVDTRHVHEVANTGSGMSVAIVDDSGDYGAVVVSGSNKLLSDGMLAAFEPAIAGSELLVLQHEVNDAANVAAARAAAKHRCPVLLNAAPAKPVVQGLSGLIDILVVNALEAKDLGASPVTDLRSAADAARALRHLASCTVVTAGAAGVAGVSSLNGGADTLHCCAGLSVEVTGTHGAGDVFVGALAARMAHGDALADGLAYANTAAGLHISTEEALQHGIDGAAVSKAMNAGSP